MKLPLPERTVTLASMRSELPSSHSTGATAVMGVPVSQLGERPVWVGEDLVWVDIDAGTAHRWVGACRSKPGGVVSARWSVPVSLVLPLPGAQTCADAPEVDATAPHGGEVVVATADGVVSTPVASMGETGESRPAEGESCRAGRLHVGRPGGMPSGHRFNDGAFDAAGRLWISTMSRAPGGEPGALWVAESDSPARSTWTWTRVLNDVACGNGIGWSVDGSTMYFAESASRSVYAFDVSTDGCVSNPRVLLALAEDGPMPDGLSVDAAGRLWVALWDGGCVLCLDPDDPERAVAAIDVPADRVTALALPRRPGDQVYLTTAAGPTGGGQLFSAPLPECASTMAGRATGTEGMAQA